MSKSKKTSQSVSRKKPKFIRSALSIATSTMLASVAPVVHAASDSTWEVDSAILFYSETDRITAVEPVVKVRKEIGEDEYVGFRIVADSLSGSSANGAIATNSAQTFTSPSGSSYTAATGETPLDPSFHDTRIALNGEWETPLSKAIKGIFSINASSEYDYESYGVAANISWDFNNRNTTLVTGLAYNSDTVKPVGGAPTGLNTMSATKTTQGSNLNKTVTDILFGVTQVVSRNTLMQFNYSHGEDDGYLTDPYKILSVLDNNGNLISGAGQYLYEKRPTTRSRNAVYWKTVHKFSEDVLHLSYRYYWDDWGLNSNTIDARYRYELGSGHYLQPHVRYYQQNQADFYHYNLVDGSTPQYASADYRLGDMTTTTFGIKYGIVLDKGQEFTARVESMKQSMGGSNQGPDVDAIILQLGYSLKF